MAKRTLTSAANTVTPKSKKAEPQVKLNPDPTRLGAGAMPVEQDEAAEVGEGKAVKHDKVVRRFEDTVVIHSDSFKLKTAKVLKQTGVNKDPDQDPSSFTEYEHGHPFHTFDSEGKRMDRCAFIAGHTHEVKWKMVDGVPVIEEVGPPVVVMKKKVRGRATNVLVPANDYDDHTHEVEYLKSSKVKSRQKNAVAAVVEAIEAQKSTPPAGAQEGA